MSAWLVIEKLRRGKWVACTSSSIVNAAVMSEILRSCKYRHPRTKYRMRKVYPKATSAAARGKDARDA